MHIAPSLNVIKYVNQCFSCWLSTYTTIETRFQLQFKKNLLKKLNTELVNNINSQIFFLGLKRLFIDCISTD